MMKLRVKVVDVGANPIDGSPPYAALLRAGNADIVGFKPNPNALAKSDHLKGPKKWPPRCLVWVATASRGADLVFLGSAESRFSAPA